MKPLRIFVLTKRQYTGKDLLDDCYGRMFEIPECLAALGHRVKGVTLSYREKMEGIFQPRLVEWESLNAAPFSPFDINRYFKRLKTILSDFQPDLIWASSDVLHAIVAWKLSCSWPVTPYVVDLYDNYESFGLTKLPGATSLLRKSCREANGLTVVSHALEKYVISNYRLKSQPIEVIGNAVDSNIFCPHPKTLARDTLGLPHAAPLIGTAGALSSTRGIEILFQAFSELSKKYPNLRLVIAGPRDSTIKRYLIPGVIDLGILPLYKVPLIFSALDVAVICNKDSSFGRYCYPQKFQEIAACNTPIVASNVGEMSYLLAQYPQLLFHPDNPSSLVEKIEYQLNHSELLNIKPLAWSDRADSLSSFFHSILFGKT